MADTFAHRIALLFRDDIQAGLPLKTSFEPRGIYYEQQMYQMLKEIYTYIYTDVDPTLKIPYKREARDNVERLLRFVKLSLHEAKGGVNITCSQLVWVRRDD